MKGEKWRGGGRGGGGLARRVLRPLRRCGPAAGRSATPDVLQRTGEAVLLRPSVCELVKIFGASGQVTKKGVFALFFCWKYVNDDSAACVCVTARPRAAAEALGAPESLGLRGPRENQNADWNRRNTSPWNVGWDGQGCMGGSGWGGGSTAHAMWHRWRKHFFRCLRGIRTLGQMLLEN